MSDLVPIAQFGNAADAELAKAYLESYGLQSAVFDGNTAAVLPGWAVRLMVLDTDFAEAHERLAEYFKEDERSDYDRTQPR